MSIHNNHRQRLKEKFLENGFNNFLPHEKLEFILFFSIPQGDTNTVAHNLLNEYKTISSIMDAPYEELIAINGVGPHTAIMLKMFPEICSIYLDGKNENSLFLYTTKDYCEFFIPKFIGKRNEELYIACLDDSNKVIRSKKIFEGSVNATVINVKLILEEIIKSNATGVIIAHNHPVGIAIPSNSDFIATKKIKDAVEMLNVRFLDHIVVANEDALSFRECNYLEDVK